MDDLLELSTVHSFVAETRELISSVRNQCSATSFQELDSLSLRIELGTESCDQLIQMASINDLEFSVDELRHLRQDLLHSLESVNNQLLPHNVAQGSSSINCGPGRPSFQINVEYVELLRSVGSTWTQIAEYLGISRSTLWRHMTTQTASLSRFSDISDEALDHLIESIQRDHPNMGLILLQGYLSGIGFHVQRRRVRESVNRVDPIQRSLRWRQRLTRRTYNVAGPNALWHIDGHHKLIRWRFVIHGGIDGFSRYCVYLHCSTNNRAETVYAVFRGATRECGIPSRVRSDRGGENYDVCYYMIRTRGTSRGSHIAGSSTHNQRIERLWRDVFRCVASTFYNIFHYMESIGILDPCNETHLLVLHCIYLPLINQHLNSFREAWNCHPVRTEHNRSPRRIFLDGVVNNDVDIIPDGDFDNYGVDHYAALPESDVEELVDSVVVPTTEVPFSDERLEVFGQRISELVYEDNAISTYVQANFILQSLLYPGD